MDRSEDVEYGDLVMEEYGRYRVYQRSPLC